MQTTTSRLCLYYLNAQGCLNLHSPQTNKSPDFFNLMEHHYLCSGAVLAQSSPSEMKCPQKAEESMVTTSVASPGITVEE
ncbi:hypothetical protein HZ326_17551 [Fusarium oxysporum f. sp. albedinis]|nr:hypothetical protein HZ326_17551 [Fusarium oxysporum f. sp. albedinis]